MADAEAKKLLAGLWATDGDRATPEELGIDRETGWGVSYEQVGSGDTPERLAFNQKNREWDGAFADRMRRGIPMHDMDIDYPQWARVIDSTGRKMVALEANGPATGNAVDPVTSGQSTWREF